MVYFFERRVLYNEQIVSYVGDCKKHQKKTIRKNEVFHIMTANSEDEKEQ